MKGIEFMKKEFLNKFYKKSLVEKIEALKQAEVISKEDFALLQEKLINLPIDRADRMIENYLLNYELPFGLAMNFVIDGKETIIPMVTEEPSVIAAASNAGKLTALSKGFETEMNNRLVIGQIVLKNVVNVEAAALKLKAQEKNILDLANAAHPSIVNYGGGAQRIETRIIPSDPAYNSLEFFVLHLVVDTAEAMGANIVNTMTEAISSYITELIGGESLMNILSNYATESIVKATCLIHPNNLATETTTGNIVRDRIIEASQYAMVDPYRAVTHNKGIMNGIDALLVATGNDWRAVEAGVHAYAARDGQYRALSQWSQTDEGYLKGEIELPISVGSVGGTLSVHPTAQLAYRILDKPSANELARTLAAVGLAQNLAALKALVTEGIQKGHMGLQARSLAIRVGAEDANIERVAERLQTAEHMNSETAANILKQLLANE